MAMTTVSCDADSSYKAAVKELARRKGVSMGAIVRQAIDEQFGDELKDLLIFFANGDTPMYQSQHASIAQPQPETIPS